MPLPSPTHRLGNLWMLEEVVGDASIPVDAEADAEEVEDFHRFIEGLSPAELI